MKIYGPRSVNYTLSEKAFVKVTQGSYFTFFYSKKIYILVLGSTKDNKVENDDFQDNSQMNFLIMIASAVRTNCSQ